ncbi:MAG: IS3 family transposase [Thermoplasmata archaeon]|nr:IS3 family transposase [Thermoplasmata archaeon]
MLALELSKSRTAEIVGLSRRALYRGPRTSSVRRTQADEPRIRAAVRRVAFARPSFGVRRVWAMLRREGLRVNCKRVHRLMAVEGLLRPAHFPRPRLPPTGRLSAERPDERWYTDLTEVETTDFGPCPLMAILDACTREVVHWEFFPTCGAAEALSVVEGAVAKRFPRLLQAPGTVLVTDQGAQFIAKRFREGTRLLGLDLRWTRKKRPEDNGLQESFHGHLKQDYLWLREPENFYATRKRIAEAIDDYNTERPHSSLGYLTPREFAQKVREEVST